MDLFSTGGPHFSSDLFGPFGRLNRLHKGGAKPTPPPNQPAKPGEPAKTIEQTKERDPNRRTRGYGSTILTTGLGASDSGNSILGG